ncbi:MULTISPECIES: hypothetical protein [Haloarcula]|uniref:Membrane-spanning protein n=1 Tax=Haloarcula pellucida TaxID=1427151 RepID=A0A830GKF1_9EURY|nr:MULTISPECIES: hypothetical protein [Halomicroarcula]MBX0347720.1 hypothetical protein [Halomicroarcula pellucida]MDS0276347.1 hypothetical protein [Halomicroarcula sp. S1AR25-4]GGN89989.1 hypothetical protein GCM10009030_11430 [Halomicroarcula pellucida]
MRIRDYLGITPRRQRQASRVMTLAMVGILAIGIERGSTGVIVNTGVGLLVTQLPPLLERDFGIALDPALTLWITTAVFLHAVGVLGLPWSETNFYAGIWWWDHVTHALSSSLVAAVGYTTVRALDRHSDEIHLPPRFVFVFILLFVLAFGVVWEVIEFTITLVAEATGNATILTQYGLEDTMLDLVFDTIGAVVVAIWGTAHLTDVVGYVEEWLETRTG